MDEVEQAKSMTLAMIKKELGAYIPMMHETIGGGWSLKERDDVLELGFSGEFDGWANLEGLVRDACMMLMRRFRKHSGNRVQMGGWVKDGKWRMSLKLGGSKLFDLCVWSDIDDSKKVKIQLVS